MGRANMRMRVRRRRMNCRVKPRPRFVENDVDGMEWVLTLGQ